MRPSTAAQSRSRFWLPYTEADVERLCSRAVFARGDALQRSGSVRDGIVGGKSLQADVAGTWSRIDAVMVTVVQDRLQADCTCNAAPFCRHAVAVLLDWLRNPTAYAPASRVNDADDDEAPAPQDVQQELAELLAHDAMPHLRDMARRRGLHVIARNKVELVQQLASALGDASSIDSAIAGLKPEERRALDAITVAPMATLPTAAAVEATYRVLDGGNAGAAEVSRALGGLLDLGLITRRQHPASRSLIYVPMPAVDERIPPLGSLLPVLDAAEAAGGRHRQAGAPSTAELGLIETLLAVVFEVEVERVGMRLPSPPAGASPFSPFGWSSRREEQKPDAGDMSGPSRSARLTPSPLLSERDMEHLVRLTGRPRAMIDFMFELLIALGIIEPVRAHGKYRLTVRADARQAALSGSPADFRAYLIDTWLYLNDAAELRLVAGSSGPLQVHCEVSHDGRVAGAPPNVGAVRKLVAAIVTHLEQRTEWYDFGALLDLLWSLSPSRLNLPTAGGYGQQKWWFSDSRRPGERLDLKQRTDWQSVWGPLVGCILAGPMTWLGLVEVLPGPDGALGFRLPPGPGPEQEAPALLVDLDRVTHVPAIFVPAAYPDDLVPMALTTLGKLTEVSRRGLRYQLPARRLQQAFAVGNTGPEVVRFLTARTHGALPDAVRATIEEWWNGYATVRLYDDVTLIELTEDILLPELMATTSLHDMVVHQFSPRLIAVDPMKVDGLIAELTRLGHTPRVIEET